MSATTGSISTSGTTTYSNNSLTYISTSGYSQSITRNISINPYVISTPYTSPLSINTNTWSWNTTPSKIYKYFSVIPLFMNYRTESGVVEDVTIISKIYEILIANVTNPFETDSSKSADFYWDLWQISTGNEAQWVMLSRSETKEIAEVCKNLILHCH